MMRSVFTICVTFALLAASSATVLGAAGQARESALEAAWSKELGGPSPIKRVIALLEKMRSELQAEADKEAEMYDKMVCWCETNEKEKTKAIADAEALDKELTAEIGSRAAKFGEDATEIDRLKSQISEDTASLKEATSIREAEAAKFRETEKDLTQSITNVKNAIQILSKHNAAGASFVQLPAPLLSSIRTVLKDLSFKQQMMRAEKSESPSKAAGTSFLSMSTGSESLSSLLEGDASMPLEYAQRMLAKEVTTAPAFLQAGAAPSGGSYNSQSGAIFGILTTMKEEFEADLAQEQKEEAKAKADFEAR